MNAHFLANGNVYQQIGNWLSTPSLQLFLLIGSAVLAISLLILALTRWGHARPVLKCVVLSIVAHVLLIGYAYGTHLIFQYPAIEEKTPVNVQMVGYEVDVQEETTDEQTTQDVRSWDEFAQEQAMPDVESLDKPVLDSELEIERVLESAQTPEPLAESLPVLSTPTASTHLADADHGVVDGDSTELTDPSFDAANEFDLDTNPVEAKQIKFQRKSQQDVQPETDSGFDSAEPVDSHPIDFDPEVFSPSSSETGPTLSDGPNTKQFSSEFVDDKAEFEEVADALPRSSQPAPLPAIDEAEADQPSMSRIHTPRRLGDGQAIPKLYQLRSMRNVDQVASRRGGNADTQRAVQLALRWLAQQQQQDGSWDPAATGAGQETRTLGHNRNGAGAQAHSGITALATLAFLGAGSTHLEGPFQPNVQFALEYLIRNQTADGNLAGNARLFARMYCHSMALLALSEALAVTGDQRLLPAVQRGVDFSVASQNKMDGGWRYQPQDRGDMSQFGWQVMALHSASIGGIEIPENTIQRMHGFLELCTSGEHRGLASYRPGQGVSSTMTAEAMVCRFFMQKKISPETINQATRRISTQLPQAERINYYYWYYATMATYHAGGEPWETWNTELKKVLLPSQIQSGRGQGSWPANGPWSGYGGTIYSTSMAALCLEVYYRYLPIYEIAKDR